MDPSNPKKTVMLLLLLAVMYHQATGKGRCVC